VEDTLGEELLEGHVQLGQEIRLTVVNDIIVPVGTTPEKKNTDPETAAAAPEKEEDPVG
jgi:ATP-dependent Clp protease ATP-binding subunit ClpC